MTTARAEWSVAAEGMLDVAGLALEVRRHGPAPGAAPTLVMLHEGLGCAGLWRDFPERLSARTGWGVLAYSRAGYGRSAPCALPRPLTYMHDEARGTLPALLDAARVDRCVLLGHSDGASIAVIHAGETADPRVLALVLLAPHFFTEPTGLAAIARARIAWRAGDLRERLARHHGENVDCAFLGWNDAWLDPGFVTWDITPQLRATRLPLLVIQGEDDEYGTVRQVETAREEAPGHVEAILLAGCGHSPHRDRPVETVGAIARFLAQLGSPGS